MTLCNLSGSKEQRHHGSNEHTLDRVVMISISRINQVLGDGINAQDTIVHPRGMLMMDDGGTKKKNFYEVRKGAYKFLSNVRVANVRNFF